MDLCELEASLVCYLNSNTVESTNLGDIAQWPGTCLTSGPLLNPTRILKKERRERQKRRRSQFLYGWVGSRKEIMMCVWNRHDSKECQLITILTLWGSHSLSLLNVLNIYHWKTRMFTLAQYLEGSHCSPHLLCHTPIWPEAADSPGAREKLRNAQVSTPSCQSHWDPRGKIHKSSVSCHFVRKAVSLEAWFCNWKLKAILKN